MVPSKADRPSLYETDYLQWLETIAAALRNQDYETIDWPNLIEEIEDMGRSERRSLESNLIILLLHLLKWQYQPGARSGSWAGSIVEHRRRVKRALQESPSLKCHLEQVWAESYMEAVKQAKAETGLAAEIFPGQCPYALADVLDDDFLPQ